MENMTKRIALLDILRGFAVLGTLGTNIWIFAHLGDLTVITTFHQNTWWNFDDFLRMLILFLVNGKLLGLLTIMFGVGLELKYRQALRKGNTWPGVYIWTSLFLMAEGLMHFLFVMEYDILMSYGITAIIVAIIVKKGDKWIKYTMQVIGSLFIAVVLLIFIVSLNAQVSLGSFHDVISLYQNGTWFDQVQYRINNLLPLRIEAIFIIPMNIFLFLLGVRLMRIGAFSPHEHGKKIRSRFVKIALLIGVPLNLLIFVPGGLFDLPVRYVFAPILSIGYIGLISIVVEKWEHFWLWKRLENVGKMSLSIYVTQNIIASILFYGWGIGLGGNLHSFTIILIWFMICIFLILFATLWLKKFQFGPVETVRKIILSGVKK
ncbi:DUF418 domain-containing protein [Oceanobacillus sp. Castelsardo]|uniref:DUF418 domain-containing protein n=1 Tax=Oceanobacillus sp. Castelsardo TaxID=1851204 RepID=UPI0008382973|nr:DUF418 domain-containing protein [Oceanobacillus sp. Castelsardo]